VLEELRICGLGVIDEATLPLGPGLTALTGETGAGKTMVITGLLLLFGGRADAARLRPGADQARIDGVILVADADLIAQRVQDAGGAVDDDGTLVLRRVVAASGRSRAYVGGAPAPVGVLADLAERLIAVHGQADQLRLARPAEQRACLDRFGGIATERYAEAFRRWRDCVTRLAERTGHARELEREAAVLAHGIAEIEAADPQAGEDEQLLAEASRLAHADALQAAARTAHHVLLGDPDDPAGDAMDVATALGVARRVLQQLRGADPELDGYAARIMDLAAVATDLGADLGSYAERLDADPGRLQVVEERRAQLAILRRRYGDDIPAVLNWAANARSRLDDLDVSEDALAALTASRDHAAAEATLAAAEISRRRAAAAARLAAAITNELAGLGMPQAEMLIEVRRRPAIAGQPTLIVDGTAVGATPDGVDEVELLLRAHVGAPALPLGRGASGGELSRIMLAVEVSLAGAGAAPTLVFDEIDAGVGGRAAIEVGRRLARLARDHQVVVVTHLAQVAAFADRHVVVHKPADITGSAVTTSDVRMVDGPERVVELARMLAGRDSPAARRHAEELLSDAAAHASAAVPGGSG
jgi:DNA repair protein RecN (Recombination protein N)